MRKVEICVSQEILVSTGAFENQRLFASFKECIEGDFSDAEIIEKQKKDFKIHCSDVLAIEATNLKIKAIQEEFKFLRVLDCPKCGKKHPSVTTVRDFDRKDFFCTDAELKIARAQGIIADIRNRHFVGTGEWLDSEKIPLCAPHLITLKGTGTNPNAYNFPAFLKKYPLKDMKNGERFFNCSIETTGEPDLIATPDKWDIAQSVPSLIDYKRTVDELSNFTQMSVYAKEYGLTQMIIIPVKADNAQGWSKPVVSGKVDMYFEVWMSKRRDFRERYGI